MLCPLDRRESELILTDNGFTCQDFHDRKIWHNEDNGLSIRLEETPPKSADEISQKIVELKSA